MNMSIGTLSCNFEIILLKLKMFLYIDIHACQFFVNKFVINTSDKHLYLVYK